MITGLLLAGGMAIMAIIIIALLGVFYIVNCVGIMNLMDAEGLTERYRAWIPFYNNYIVGEIVESEIGDSQIVFVGVTKWIMALYPIACVIPELGEIVVAVAGLYCVVVLCVFAERYNSLASMIISSIFALSGIGMIILAGRIKLVHPDKVMKKAEPTHKSETQRAEKAAKVVAFEVEKTDATEETESNAEAKPDNCGLTETDDNQSTEISKDSE